jgi:endonuclease YncB( thermonuclease family)
MTHYDELRKYKDISLKSYDGINCPCIVTKVIDGDTLEILCKIEEKFEKHRLRLYGIDTPEIHTRNIEEKEDGLHAKKVLSRFVEKHNGEGNIKFMKDDKYGRRLGELFINNINVKDYLLECECGVSYFGGKKNKTY